MAKPRMDLSAFVGKLLEEQNGDVLSEGIRVLSQALMETEVAGLMERHERTGDRTAVSEWRPDADLGHAHGHDRTGDPEGAARDVFTLVAADPPARGARVARRHPGSIRVRRLHPEGRRSGESANPPRKLGWPAAVWNRRR